jgi:hypothetical protein
MHVYLCMYAFTHTQTLMQHTNTVMCHTQQDSGEDDDDAYESEDRRHSHMGLKEAEGTRQEPSRRASHGGTQEATYMRDVHDDAHVGMLTAAQAAHSPLASSDLDTLASLDNKIKELEAKIAHMMTEHEAAIADQDSAHATQLAKRESEIIVKHKAEIAEEKGRCAAVLHQIMFQKSQDDVGEEGDEGSPTPAIVEDAASESMGVGDMPGWERAAKASRAEGDAIVREFDSLRAQVSRDFAALKEAARKVRDDDNKGAGGGGQTHVTRRLGSVFSLVDELEAAGEVLLADLAPTVVSALDKECEMWRRRALHASSKNSSLDRKVAELQRQLVDAEEVAFVKLDELEAEAEDKVREKMCTYQDEIERLKLECTRSEGDTIEARRVLVSVQAALVLVTCELADCVQLFAGVEELVAYIDSKEEQHRQDLQRLHSSTESTMQRVSEEKQEKERQSGVDRVREVEEVREQMRQEMQEMLAKWEGQQDVLQREIKELEDKVSTCMALAEEERIRAEGEKCEYETEIIRLIEEAEASDAQKERLEEELMHARGQAQNTMQETSQTRLEDEIAAVKKDAQEQIEGMKEDYERQMAEVKKDAEEAQARFEEQRTAAAQVAQRQVEDLETEMRGVRSEVRTVQQKLADAHSTLAASQEEARGLRDELRDCHALASLVCIDEEPTLDFVRAMAARIADLVGGLEMVDADGDGAGKLQTRGHSLTITSADASTLCDAVQRTVDTLWERLIQTQERDTDAAAGQCGVSPLWQQRLQNVVEQLTRCKVCTLLCCACVSDSCMHAQFSCCKMCA